MIELYEKSTLILLLLYCLFNYAPDSQLLTRVGRYSQARGLSPRLRITPTIHRQ